MARNSISDAIILKNLRFGEMHKSATLLSPDHGVFTAIAHGAYKGKSRLSGVTEIFSYSRIYLYHDPVKNSFKISDVEPIEVYENIRGDLSKYYTASLWAEVIINTFGGGGEYGVTFSLMRDGLGLLDSCETEKIDTILSLFLFRYIESLGYLPDFSNCARCGKRLSENEAWYTGHEGATLCSACGNDGLPVLTPGARRYLMYATSRPLSEQLKVNLDQASRAGMKRALIAIIQHVIGKPLNSVAKSGGIL